MSINVKACVDCGRPPRPRSKRCWSCTKAKDKADKRHYESERARLKRQGPGFTTFEWACMRSFFGNRCLSCGRKDGAHNSLQPDHVIPLSRGGAHCIRNIQPLCSRCNSTKKEKSTDYRDPEKLEAFLIALEQAKEELEQIRCHR